jgi:flagellar capping protein FliD
MPEIEPYQLDEEKPHRLEAYIRFMNPDDSKTTLTPKQQEVFELMKNARGWRMTFFSRNQTMRKLMEEKGCSQSRAYQIIDDSDTIYARLDNMNKDAERGIQYEMLYRAFHLAMSDKEATGLQKALAIERLVDKMANLTGTKNHEQNFDVTKLLGGVNITFELGGRENPIIDIEHEVEEK